MNFYFLNDKVTRMKKVIKIKGRLGYIFNGNSIRVDYGRHMLKELGCTKWGGDTVATGVQAVGLPYR